MNLYPLKFKTICKEKIWGGNKLKTLYNKKYKEPNCGETWELSGVEENVSVVSNGFLKGNTINELIEVYMGDLVGDEVFDAFGIEFPLLIKFIDANDWLSVQVHPDDALSMKRHNAYGKTEMWYVLQADQGAQLITGFKEKLDKKKYLEHFMKGTLKEVLNFEEVKAGDVFEIPAGRVHALGPGILLAEIQQTSDVTYRIYDWDRTDKDGKPREMHTDLAVDAIDFSHVNNYRTQYQVVPNDVSPLVQNKYFNTNLLKINKNTDRSYYALDSFVIYICTEGIMDVVHEDGSESLSAGEIMLIPASIKAVSLHPKNNASLLEVFIYNMPSKAKN